MALENFDFKRYQSFRKSRKMIVRFIIYGVVILLLLYLIMYKGEGKQQNKKLEHIELDVKNINDGGDS